MESEKSEKDLIVDVTSTEVHIALMENHRLIELNKESSKGHSFSVGDVYLGKVKKILPALNAAFVDIGDKKEAFVHYLDLGLYFTSFDEFVRKSNPNTDLGELYSGIPIGPILEKRGPHRERAEARTDDDSADRQGTDLHERVTTDRGNFIGRT